MYIIDQGRSKEGGWRARVGADTYLDRLYRVYAAVEGGGSLILTRIDTMMVGWLGKCTNWVGVFENIVLNEQNISKTLLNTRREIEIFGNTCKNSLIFHNHRLSRFIVVVFFG